MPTEPNGLNVVIGPGLLWIAPIGSPEPVGVLTPVSVGATAEPWPSAWTMLGYTETGHTFDWTPQISPVPVAEELLPIRYATTGADAKVMFAMAEITAKHISTALNGGTIVTAAGITTFTPPHIGQEQRTMLGWDRDDGLERMVWRRCVQTGSVNIPRGKSPAKAMIPCQFNLEKPVGVEPYKHIFDASLAA